MNKKKLKFVKKNKVAILAVSAALVLLASSITVVKADVSFWDKVAQWTGVKIAEKVDIPDSFLKDVENVSFGAMPGPDVYNRMYFHEGFQSGGTVVATSSSHTSYTLAVGDIGRETSYLDWTPSATTTVTTMATSSVAMDALNIPNAGDMRELWIYNNTVKVKDKTITIAAGTGVDLQKNEDTADLAIDGTSLSKLTFIRKANTDVMLILEQYDK